MTSVDLEWKLTYVGSAESAAHDQILDTVVVGPVPVGKHKFVFQADQPDPEKIPVADAIGVTAVLLTCSYKEHEFVRVGYFVNNDYTDPELKDNPPPVPQFDKVILQLTSCKFLNLCIFTFFTLFFTYKFIFFLDDTKHPRRTTRHQV